MHRKNGRVGTAGRYYDSFYSIIIHKYDGDTTYIGIYVHQNGRVIRGCRCGNCGYSTLTHRDGLWWDKCTNYIQPCVYLTCLELIFCWLFWYCGSVKILWRFRLKKQNEFPMCILCICKLKWVQAIRRSDINRFHWLESCVDCYESKYFAHVMYFVPIFDIVNIANNE